MAEKHTPTPWKYGHVGTDALWIGPDYNRTPVAHVDHDMEYARDNSRANAAFIVRATNSHDRLVEALRKIMARDSSIDASPRGERRLVYGEFAQIARAALSSLQTQEEGR